MFISHLRFISLGQKSADCEGRKPGKEAADEIAPSIRPAFLVRAQTRIPGQANLRNNCCAVLAVAAGGSYLILKLQHHPRVSRKGIKKEDPQQTSAGRRWSSALARRGG